MDRFSKLNPKAAFLFFILIIAASLILFHPAFLAVSFLSAFCYKVKLEGKTAFSYLFKFILPMTVLIGVFNMFFARYGETVMFSLGENNFTFESLFYGICQGIMFSGVLMWFSCYSQVITSERLFAVFGRFAPNTALVFSMVLSFIPRFKKNLAEIRDARELINDGTSKLKKELSNFSALITMVFEESIETANSMKSRGFSKGRTPYSKYSFSFKDAFIIAVCIICFVFLAVIRFIGKISFIFEPVIIMKSFSFAALAVYIFFAFLPLIIDLTEDIRWLYLKQKI